MTRRVDKASALIFLAILLAACGSTPQSTHYLLSATLDEVPTGQSPAIGVGPIDIPEYLNRNTLVYRGNGNELQIAQQSRWAEPLEDGISRVLGLNLAGLLNTENVRTHPWHPKRPPEYSVKIRVLGMDALEGEAVLVAEWLVYQPGNGGQETRKISKHSLSLDTQRPIPAQLPEAYSTLLYKLSEEIAGVIGERADTSEGR